MPTYEIEVGGKVYEVDADKELSDTDVLGYAKQFSTPKKQKSDYAGSIAATDPIKGQNVYSKQYEPGGFEKAAKTAWEGLKDVGRAAWEIPATMAEGAARQIVGGLYGLGGGGAEGVERVTKDSYVKPESETAKTLGAAAGLAGEAVSKGLGALYDASPMVRVGQYIRHGSDGAQGVKLARENERQTIEDYGAEAIGAVVPAFKALRKGAAPAVVRRLNQEQQAIVDAQKAGYLFNPAKANPNALNEAIQSLGGKYIDEKLALKGQSLTDVKARRAMGLPGDAILDDGAFDHYRRIHGNKYDAVRGHTQPFSPDAQFRQEVRDLDKPFRAMKENFPELYDQPELERMIGALETPKSALHPGQFDAASIIDISKDLRASAKKTLNNPSASPSQKSAAIASYDAANSLEDLLDRHLQQSGNTKLLEEFRDARKQIAISHDVEFATNPVTGHVDAQKLARLLDKGKPLSGDLLEIARAAKIDKKNVRNTEALRRSAGLEAGDVGNAGILWRLWHSPKATVAAMARPIAAAIGSSDWYQAVGARPKPKMEPRPSLMKDAVTAGILSQEPQDESSDR